MECQAVFAQCTTDYALASEGTSMIRKMNITNEEFYGLIESHKTLMRKMLSKEEMGRVQNDNVQPQQLDLFSNVLNHYDD